MDGTTKTVLIVGVAAVAAFVLLRTLAPMPRPVTTRPAANGVTLRGVVDVGSALFSAGQKLFGSSTTAPPPSEIDGVSTADFQAGHFGVDYS
jgi:hypothetical protein